MTPSSLKAVLFDLDGTLIDTAPDLAYTLNLLLTRYQRSTPAFADIRPTVAHGTRGLLQLGFGIDEQDANYANLQKEFLETYHQHLTRETSLFSGMDAVLNHLEKKSLLWGIVTNKPAWLTEPLLRHLNLWDRTACVVSGDTLKIRKPHPEPLLHACKLINCAPSACIYVGDTEDDMQAGQRAGMYTVLARYGYGINAFSADAIINHPEEILKVL
jgi:N-acetyl-D-muramate 6-phosphate phosphatase